jgi:hypothetical protein
MDVAFVKTFAPGLSNNGALSKLVMRQNNISGAEAGKAFADMLAQNTALKELDLSSQKVGNYGNALDAAFAKKFAVGISDNGTLMKFDISENSFCVAGAKALAEGLKGNQVMTELNLAGNAMCKESGEWGAKSDMSGVIALADVIPGMRALMKLTFGDKQVVTMTTEMTEANFNGMLKSCEAQVVAAFVPKCM